MLYETMAQTKTERTKWRNKPDKYKEGRLSESGFIFSREEKLK